MIEYDLSYFKYIADKKAKKVCLMCICVCKVKLYRGSLTEPS